MIVAGFNECDLRSQGVGMTSSLKNCLRWPTPFGLIERHRRRFRMKRLGLPDRREVADAVVTCRYELWPDALRHPLTPWALVDVGANEGGFIRAAHMLTSLSAVYAFEPQQECQASLAKAVGRVANGIVYQAAAGERRAEIELICTRNNKLSSILRPTEEIARHYARDDFHRASEAPVTMMPLDDVIPPDTPIGLVKIDVQGYELQVLRGAARTLERTGALLVEMNYVSHYLGAATFDEIHAAVRQLGFRTYGISGPYAGRDGPLWADGMFVNQRQ